MSTNARDVLAMIWQEYGFAPARAEDKADRQLAALDAADLTIVQDWQSIESMPVTPDTQPLPNYVMLFNGFHRGIGFRRESYDPDFGAQFWSETGEPIEPPPTHWAPIMPAPRQ